MFENRKWDFDVWWYGEGEWLSYFSFVEKKSVWKWKKNGICESDDSLDSRWNLRFFILGHVHDSYTCEES